MERRGGISLAWITSIITISFGDLELILVCSSRNEQALKEREKVAILSKREQKEEVVRSWSDLLWQS
jgi:hypothetical protein